MCELDLGNQEHTRVPELRDVGEVFPIDHWIIASILISREPSPNTIEQYLTKLEYEAPQRGFATTRLIGVLKLPSFLKSVEIR